MPQKDQLQKGVIKDGEDELECCLSDLKPIDSLVMASPFHNFQMP